MKKSVFICFFACIGVLYACFDQPRMGDLKPPAKNEEPHLLAATQPESAGQAEDTWPVSFGFGQRASARDIEQLDISIRPDGKGLPQGRGNVKDGEAIYRFKCAACHGQTGVEGPYDVLVSKDGQKAIGTYWPYATTLFDYIRRTMPFNMPGSLTNEEVYHLTAYLLHANGILSEEEEVDAKSLPKVEMPAKALFVPDDRKGGPEIK